MPPHYRIGSQRAAFPTGGCIMAELCKVQSPPPPGRSKCRWQLATHGERVKANENLENVVCRLGLSNYENGKEAHAKSDLGCRVRSPQYPLSECEIFTLKSSCRVYRHLIAVCALQAQVPV